MARRPSIVIRAKVDGEHRFFAAQWNTNGTLRPGFAKHRREPFMEYAYYVRWTEGDGRRRMKCAGRDASMAMMMAQERRRMPVLPPEKAPEPGAVERRMVKEVLQSWTDWAKAHKSKGTYDAYKCSADLFLDFCNGNGIAYLDQITEGRLLDYKLSLERQGYAEPTRFKLLNQLHGALRRAKCRLWLERDDMPQKDDGHRYVEWTPEQTKAMLEKGCTELGDWLHRATEARNESSYSRTVPRKALN
jgi:Phage integrase SAM-like domain